MSTNENSTQQVSANPVKNRTEPAAGVGSFNTLVVVAALMVTTYLTANIMAVKLVSIFGIAMFDAGIITFPLAYLLGDVLTEIWGFKTARKVIWLTFACNILLVAATSLGLLLPSPDYMAATTQAYSTIFSVVPRILAASLVAFLAGELVNAALMERIGIWTAGRHLWLRTIGSSAIGYLFDTVIFVLIAFAGVAPLGHLIAMIAAQYLVKILIEAVAGTPLAYLAIGYLRRKGKVN